MSISEEQRIYLRGKLLQERERYRSRIEYLREESFGQDRTATIREPADYDNHPADQGSETYERESDLGLLLEARDHLKSLEEALVRMQDGQYGYCSGCGRDIPFERLSSRPDTDVCVECASQD